MDMMFLIVMLLIVVSFLKIILEWIKNNNSPQLTVPATVVCKRTSINTHNHNAEDNIVHSHTSTTYYVTFEMDNGERKEFNVRGREYGVVVEGDCGKLSYQGTRYLGFER